MSNYDSLLSKLKTYKHKYYKNMLIRGTLLTFALLLTAFIAINTLEYFGNFNPYVRGALFFSFVGLMASAIYFWIVMPLLKLWELRKPLSNQEAAQQIGSYFPEVSDKLLNLIQLGGISASDNALLQASIDQKSEKMSLVDFSQAVHYEDNRKYLRYVLPPLMLLLLLFWLVPPLFTESTPRLIRYSESFEPKMPFRFELINKDLQVFKNEDFDLKLKITGNAVPEQVYLNNSSGRKVRMERLAGTNEYVYKFPKVQKKIDFNFEASGFSSSNYEIKVLERPSLSNFVVKLHYPPYTQKTDEILQNTGNLIVPAGTAVQWIFSTQQTANLNLFFAETKHEAKSQSGGFEFSRQVFDSENYKVVLKNEFSQNKENIEYFLQVIPDEYPSINLKQYEDTTLYNFLAIGGNVADDYGVSRLQFRYQIYDRNNRVKGETQNIGLPFNANLVSQSYFYQMDLSKIELAQGERLEYWAEVWDNDGVKGAKSSKTSIYTFQVPDKEEFKKELEAQSAKTEKDLEKTLEKAQKLKQNLNEVQDRLKSKKQLNWQDKKLMEQVIKDRQELEQAIQQLQQQNQMLNQKQERFSERSKEISEKAEKLSKLMEEMLDPETKKLYEQLNKLLEQERNQNQIQDLLDKIDKKELNVEKELDRALEMFKKLQFEQKLKEVANDLKELSQDQMKLAEQVEKVPDGKKVEKVDSLDKKDQKTNKKSDSKDQKSDQKNSDQKDQKSDSKDQKSDSKDQKDQKSDSKDQKDQKSDSKDQKKEDQKNSDQKDQKQTDEKQDQKEKSAGEQKQEELNEKFEEVEKDIKEMEKLNKERKTPDELPENMPDQQKQVKEQQQKSKESLEQKENKKAAEKQRDAAKKMKEMAEELEEQQQAEEEKQQVEDYNMLRQILENLVKLSFDQEALMKEFRGIRTEDPRLVPLGQKQLDLKEDAKIIEDSLTALAKRVFQIESFVTREMTTMNDYMNSGMEEIKKRNLGFASAKQQLAMTSMNNLALMLDEVLHNMKEQMSPQNGSGKPQMQIMNKKRKERQKEMENLGDMQKSLNQQIENLKKGGQTGKQMSESLAKMAAQQEMIRKAMQEMMQGLEKNGKNGKKQEGGGNIAEMLEKMEKTEEDLVNKRITQETLNRQKEILTRLLESEKAMREREKDQKREAEHAKDKNKVNPPQFSDYLKQKEKQIELLKTIPPSLNPYYKKEVNEYFKKLD